MFKGLQEFCSRRAIDDLMYATVESTNLFRSTDGGNTWSEVQDSTGARINALSAGPVAALENMRILEEENLVRFSGQDCLSCSAESLGSSWRN